MRIVNVDNNIIKELRKCDISTKMRSLESCEWVVLEEIDGIIIGAAGLGGLFHVSGIQISEIHAGKGIGKRLQNELINESKRRGYSFILVFNDPRNIHSERLHNSLGYERIFRIHNSDEKIQDVRIIIFKSSGKIIKKFLSCFNSKIGIFFLACTLKATKPLFKKVLSYNEENIPSPSIITIVSKFEKL